MGSLLILFCLSLICFVYARGPLQKWLTQTVFRRGDLNLYSQRILRLASETSSEKEVLNHAALELYNFVDAEQVTVSDISSDHARGTNQEIESLSRQYPWAEVHLQLRFSRGDSSVILLGARRGSRRYLTEDIDALNRLCTLLTE